MHGALFRAEGPGYRSLGSCVGSAYMGGHPLCRSGVRSATARCGRAGAGRPGVHRVPRHLWRRLRRGDPPGGFPGCGALRHCLNAKLFLVRRGTPAAGDQDLDAPACSGRCRLTKGTGEGRIKPGHRRIRVIKGAHAVGNEAVCPAQFPLGEWRRCGRQTRHGGWVRGRRHMPPATKAGCCPDVCGFRYAGGMFRRVALGVQGCADRRGRSLAGSSRPRQLAFGSQRWGHRPGTAGRKRLRRTFPGRLAVSSPDAPWRSVRQRLANPHADRCRPDRRQSVWLWARCRRPPHGAVRAPATRAQAQGPRPQARVQQATRAGDGGPAAGSVSPRGLPGGPPRRADPYAVRITVSALRKRLGEPWLIFTRRRRPHQRTTGHRRRGRRTWIGCPGCAFASNSPSATLGF
ncbi:hypothetical protein SAMN00790413_06437 [Deinococcus hopiensis KR-140]|uniref:Uncharacterized protein n=1 Tax=Deinococcus hopiensis KR-140 TaxID=695939 RepID=A0A1W1VVH2_9DEIO|nr:hypothetical protein SAMN00790413_06437 [Deinococcus hopiensis KR-140]